MRRIALLVAFALTALALGGCASVPRMGSTFDLGTDLTVEEALYARQNLDRLEAHLVRKIREIDPAEIYRATIIDHRMEGSVPYQMLAESITMHISEVELRHYLEQPDAWVKVTFTVRRLDENPNVPESAPQAIAWHHFLHQIEPEMDWSRDLLAKIMKNGDPWISTKIRDAAPPDKSIRIDQEVYDPSLDGGFWQLEVEEPEAAPSEEPQPSID